MRLVHYSKNPVEEVRPVAQVYEPSRRWAPKPTGLWVSDEDEYGWSRWCREEAYAEDRLKIAHEVELVADPRILFLHDAEDMFRFTEKYSFGTDADFPVQYWLDWPAIAEVYHGIIITPYIVACRMALQTSWYYPWDCASGCIWNPDAIASIKVLDAL